MLSLHWASLLTGVATIAILPAAGTRRWTTLYNTGLALGVLSAGLFAAERVQRRLLALEARSAEAEEAVNDMLNEAIRLGHQIGVARLDDHRP